MALFVFASVMYLNASGVLPAASRLNAARSSYEASGAPKSVEEMETLYLISEDQNAASILSYLPGKDGARTRIEFPSLGKKSNERYSITWKQFAQDIDRAANRKHFRPKRDFTNPYGILLPEYMFFRGGMRECLSQAVGDLDLGDLSAAEQNVKRAVCLDQWSTDQPFLIGKLVRLQGSPQYFELVGKLVDSAPSQAAVLRMLKSLETAANRDLEMGDVGKVEAFATSRITEEPDYVEACGGSVIGGSKGSNSLLKEAEAKLFGYVLKSSLGQAALVSRTYTLADDFYREFKSSQDLDKAFAAYDKSLKPGDGSRLTEFLAALLPMVSGSSMNDSILSRRAINAQLIAIARWVYLQKEKSDISLTSLTAAQLPTSLQFDSLNNPIRILRSGNELRIYSFGTDGADDLGGSKDIGFSLQLRP